jgi:lysophospholipase L1-like esterase
VNRDVTITQTDVTLRRNDRPIELTQASAEIIAVGVAGPQGPQGPAGPGIASGGLRGQSLVKFSATSNDAGWVYPSDLSQPAALRRWARSFGGVRQGKLFGGGYRRTTDVMWVGDSIGEGSSSVEDSSTIVNIFTDNLSEYANANGLSGRWVPAGIGWRTSPRFQAETIGSEGTTILQGLSIRGMTLEAVAGAQKGQSMLLTWTGDNLLIHYRKRKTTPSSGSIRFQLQNRDGGGNWQVLRTFAVIDTVETDAAVPTDGHKLYAFNVASEYFNATFQVLPRAEYRILVSQWSPTSAGTGGSVQFDGAYICDGNAQQGIRVWNASRSGTDFSSFNNTVDATLNDDWLSALRNALIDPSLVVIALGTNEQATTNNWVNGPSNADAIEAKLRQMVTDIKAAYTVGYPTSAAPSIALFVPPASYLHGSADWQLVRNMYQRVATDLNLAIWDWAEFTGDVNFQYAFVGQLNATITASTNPVTISTPLNVTAGATIIIDSEQMIVGSVAGSTLTISTRGANGTTAASHSANAYIYNLGIVAGTGDPQDWTSGDSNKTHPNTVGHRTIGDFATSQAMSAVNAPRNQTPMISVGDIPALSVGTAQLIDAAVTTDKIGLSAVTGTKIASQTIGADNIAPGTITQTQISESANILPGSILGTAVITTDSRLSDARTPNSHASTHASGGSDPLTAASTSVIGVVQLTDSTTSTSTSTAATPNAVKTAIDRIEESQNHPSGGFDVIPRTSTIGGVALSASNAQLTFFTVPSAMTVSQISYAVAGTVSSGLTRGRFGLYSFDGTTVTLLARTDSDTTVFNTANTVYTRSFSTTGGYPATYDLVPGVRYAIAVLVNGTTAGNLAAVSITPNTVAALTPRMNASITLSGADLPATSSSLNNTTFLAWGRVS